MIDTLVTYIAFDRMQDINTFFVKNIQIVNPKRSIVYIDNVYDDFHKEVIYQTVGNSIEVRTGNWRDKNLCVINIINDLRKESGNALIIDSDNLLDPGFGDLDNAMEKLGHDFYTILEHARNSMALEPSRIRELEVIDLPEGKVQVESYKIAGIFHAIFYLGPKQGIRLGRRFLESLDGTLLDDVERALKRMHVGIGNQLSDEATLGLIFYYSGLKSTPWVEFTTHMQHSAGTGSGSNYSHVLKSIAHCALARGAFSNKRPRVYWYYFRYKATEIIRTLIGG
jgi:hypothetical protein